MDTSRHSWPIALKKSDKFTEKVDLHSVSRELSFTAGAAVSNEVSVLVKAHVGTLSQANAE
jgi:hypothetical protein